MQLHDHYPLGTRMAVNDKTATVGLHGVPYDKKSLIFLTKEYKNKLIYNYLLVLCLNFYFIFICFYY